MVKVGFICEGRTEKMILDSNQFRELLVLLKLELIEDVIDVKGNGNLLPQHLEDQSQELFNKGAQHIIILTDRDEEPCITTVKERISAPDKHTIVVAVQQVEAWFLADTEAMKSLLRDGTYMDGSPETHLIPFEKIRILMVDKTGRGIPTKRLLARRILETHHFSIARAAEHPNCPSAAYFMQKLSAIANTNN